MSKVIAITNHKGGVGKTTSALNLGAGLVKLGKRVLLVDMDPQANLSHSLNILQPKAHIYGALRGEYGLQAVEIVPGLELIPSTLDLAGAEIELNNRIGRENILKRLLEPLRKQYDYILVDCPPSLGLLTINALTASDEVYIPLQAQFLALEGLSKLQEIISGVREELNGHLKIGGVFITQYDSRKVLNREIAGAVLEQFKDRLFNTKIRDNVALAEAPAERVDIFRYQASSYGAEDYLALAREVAGRTK